MRYTKQSSSENMGQTAQNMIELAYMSGEEVTIQWGEDVITVTANDDVEDILILLEESADRQQNEAGI